MSKFVGRHKKTRDAQQILEEDFEPGQEVPRVTRQEVVGWVVGAKNYVSGIFRSSPRDEDNQTVSTRHSINEDDELIHIHNPPTGLRALAKSKGFNRFLLLLAFIAVSVGAFIVYDVTRVPEYTCPSAGQASVEVETGRKIRVSSVGSGNICILEGTSVLGRSYDGTEWEASITSPNAFSCSGTVCEYVMPRDLGDFSLVSYGGIQNLSATTPAALTSKEISRFLMQTTFGPQKSEIDSFGTKTFKEWIVEQMNETASLHRAYYRRRVNPRVEQRTLPGRVRTVCETNARFYQYAFTVTDLGKTIEVIPAPERNISTLRIDGIPRTEADIEVWNPNVTLFGPFIVCSVEEAVGGDVIFGTNCELTLPNPGIAFDFTLPPTLAPTGSPSTTPTKNPTVSPSSSPTRSPSSSPTFSPSASPTKLPTDSPTPEPSLSPTVVNGTQAPTVAVTGDPTTAPSLSPTKAPSLFPTAPNATNAPTDLPSPSPTNIPTSNPTFSPAFVQIEDRVITLQAGESLVEIDTPAPKSDVRLLQIANGDTLANCDVPGSGPRFVLNPDDGLFYQFDPRLVLEENTPESPAEGFEAGDEFCLNVPKTFLNMDDCIVGGKTCIPSQFTSVKFNLDTAAVREFYTRTSDYVYYLSGLRLDDEVAPCDSGASRWAIFSSTSCGGAAGNGNIDPATEATLVGQLTAATDTNPFVRDILVPDGAACDATGTKGVILELPNGECWEHVHPHLFNVYDLSTWSLLGAHPGNAVALEGGRPNPIKKWADTFGLTTLSFPFDHDMERWDDNNGNFPLLGRLGDEVDFSLIPSTVQNNEMAEFFGAVAASNPDEDFNEICGSPGEIANDPSLGSRFTMARVSGEEPLSDGPEELDYNIDHKRFKTATWVAQALYAKDQLRQRIAFILSGILVITEQQVISEETESYLSYYDIFVRNAFGNYKDVLKEVSFHPMMCDMLTYFETKSFEYSLRTFNREIFPDENYAREIMQLFTVGLLRLNEDGTVMTDAKGTKLETYTNDDIFGFARVWTGFSQQNSRGNIESIGAFSTHNRIDPLRIIAEFRDQFPKMDLYRGHIGDGYPLCIDLPAKMFLRKGATFLYLGKSPLPTKQTDPGSFDVGNDILRVELDDSSNLYTALCDPDTSNNDKCRYKSKVVLTENLVCDGIECDLDTVRTVNVSGAFYEFVRPGCIEFPFYKNGVKISHADTREAMCAQPEAIAAGEACCNGGDDTATQTCLYHGQRSTFATAESSCAAQGKVPCDFSADVSAACEEEDGYFWTSGSCTIKVKVTTDLGKVAIVHDPTPGPSGGNTYNRMRRHVRDDNLNWFRVAWAGNSFPSIDNNCKGVCQIVFSDCLCDISVTETAVFSSIPTTAEALARLKIGSVSPDTYDVGAFTLIGSANGVEAHGSASGSPFDKDTIFRVEQYGEVIYLRNCESIVMVPSGDSFRNPANLMGLIVPTRRDAEYETDAVLDHFLYHPNTAPFIAYRFIQRLVASNPSPRFVKEAAAAFKAGVYDGIGTGKYGDLSALVAAILLNREAREKLLDADPTFGQLREPLLKVVHTLRSLEASPRGNREIEMDTLEDTINQMAHYAPSVFSFFKPEYAPPGLVADAGLVAPEAEVFTGPKVIGMMNGLISLVRFGLTDCYDGFGEIRESRNCGAQRSGSQDPRDFAIANLDWVPAGSTPTEIVDELDLLLTGGRLESISRNSILKYYNEEELDNGAASALKVAQQLMVSTPEFHASNVVQRKSEEQRVFTVARNGTRPFKAIVYLFFSGGLDSYNLFVPHSDCRGGKDMYQEYADMRSNVALDAAEILQFTVPEGSQVCNRFGLHPSLTRLHQMYQNRDAVLIANVGNMVEPVSREQYNRRTVNLPESLFSHNIQQQSSQTMIPQTRTANGVIGRMNDQLFTQGYSTGSFSISGNNFVLEPTGPSPAQDFVGGGGVDSFNPSASGDIVNDGVTELVGNKAKSFFAETWTSTVTSSLKRTEVLNEIMDSTVLEQPWGANTGLGRQFEQVSKLIKSHEQLGMDRQTFFVEIGGFDTHSNAGSTLINRFNQIDQALGAFEDEMKLQGHWEDVTVISSSDFARTFTSNGAGTDHAWGGNYFLAGGGLLGGKMVGTYPDDLTNNGEQNIGRGRFIPTSTWDGVWNAIATWFGVPPEFVVNVLPNRDNFPESMLINQNEIFGTFDPSSLFYQWATILTVSITMSLFGLALVVAMKRNGGFDEKDGEVQAGTGNRTSSREYVPGSLFKDPEKKTWWEIAEAPREEDDEEETRPQSREDRLPSI